MGCTSSSSRQETFSAAVHRTLDDASSSASTTGVYGTLRDCVPGQQWIRVETDDMLNGVRICVGRFEGIEDSDSKMNKLIHLSWAWSKWGIEPLWDETRPERYRAKAMARCHRRFYVQLDDAVNVWMLPSPVAVDDENDRLLSELPIRHWLLHMGITESERPLTPEEALFHFRVEIDPATRSVHKIEQCVAAASWVAWFRFQHPKMARAVVSRLLAPFFVRATPDCSAGTDDESLDCLRLREEGVSESDLRMLGERLTVWPPARSLDPFLHDDDVFKTLNGTIQGGGWRWLEFTPWNVPSAMQYMYESRLGPKPCHYNKLYWAEHIDAPRVPSAPVSRRPPDNAWVRVTTPQRVWVGQWPPMTETMFTDSVVNEITGGPVGPRGRSSRVRRRAGGRGDTRWWF